MNQSKRGGGMSRSKHSTRPPGISNRSNLISSASKKSVAGGVAPSDKSLSLRTPVQVTKLVSCWTGWRHCKLWNSGSCLIVETWELFGISLRIPCSAVSILPLFYLHINFVLFLSIHQLVFYKKLYFWHYWCMAKRSIHLFGQLPLQ